MQKPNILFIMTDQQRYDCLGCNGNGTIKTPYIDRLASQSANFSSFFIQAPVCVPSRQTFFSGRYPRSHKNRVNYTSMDGDVKLMQKFLQEEGYKTAFVGKLHYFPPTREYALSTGFDYGLLHDGGPNDKYSDYVTWLKNKRVSPENEDYRACRKDMENPYVTVIPEKYHETTWCGSKTREMLRELAKKEEPFFLFSSYWKPHSPFEVPEPWASMYDNAAINLPSAVMEEYVENLVLPLKTLALRDSIKHYKIDRDKLMWQYRAYYGAISQIDHEVGLTIDELERLGLSDNTIVIFCSDHGDMMHEHGMIDKNTFFESAIHVPFLIRYAGKVIPGAYDDLIESTDVLSTIFELSDLKIPYFDQGRSFAGLITGGASESEYKAREYVFAENIIPEVITNGMLDFYYEKGVGIKNIRHPDAKMVRTKRWKYNYYINYEELYDLENDPGEMINLAGRNEYKETKEKLKNILIEWLITADEAEQIAPFWYAVKDNRGEWTRWNEWGHTND